MSTTLDPSNPLDYINAMGNVVNSINANTLSTVQNIVSGLPSISSLSNSAYSFENSVSANSQAALNQTLFGDSSQQTGGFNAGVAQSHGIEGMLQNAYDRTLPVLMYIGEQASANESAAIQAQNSLSQAIASSGGGGGGGKK